MPDPIQCTLDRSQAVPGGVGEMTTVTSARGLLLIWTSFLTGLFLAYCLCSAARFVNARSQAVLPPARPVIVEKIYERRAPGAQPANERNQGG